MLCEVSGDNMSETKNWLEPIPNSLDEAVQRIIDNIPQMDREAIRRGEHLSHHGFGTMLRNEWGLWHFSVLSDWFWDNVKIWHADDMSGIIIEKVEAHIKEQPFNLEQLVAHYHAHWLKYTSVQPGERPKDEDEREEAARIAKGLLPRTPKERREKLQEVKAKSATLWERVKDALRMALGR
jgi:hypothetical protein